MKNIKFRKFDMAGRTNFLMILDSLTNGIVLIKRALLHESAAAVARQIFTALFLVVEFYMNGDKFAAEKILEYFFFSCT